MTGNDDTTLDAALRAIAAGAFEDAEAIAETALTAGEDGPALRLAYATALAKQLCFGRAIEASLHVLHRADCGVERGWARSG